MSPTDLSTTVVTIAVNGYTKHVEDYFGTPDVVREFEREIDGGHARPGGCQPQRTAG
jgi:hypothetical protein